MHPDNNNRLLEFSEKQRVYLYQEYMRLTMLLASWKFNEPQNRELLMLQHAAVSGSRDQLLVLLEHDERVIQAAQELQSQSQNQSPE